MSACLVASLDPAPPSGRLIIKALWMRAFGCGRDLDLDHREVRAPPVSEIASSSLVPVKVMSCAREGGLSPCWLGCCFFYHHRNFLSAVVHCGTRIHPS